VLEVRLVQRERLQMIFPADEDLSIDVARRLAAQTHRFDGLGHAWMTEDPATTAAVLQQFWSSVA
jgi:hypothetical protein